jgi:WD40 repeat protein
VLSGGGDKTLKLFDLETIAELRTFIGHASSVSSVAFSANGRQIVSAGSDNAMRIWNAATGELLVSIFASSSETWLAMTPEGFFVSSPKGARMLKIVRGMKAFAVDHARGSIYRPDLVQAKLAGDPTGKVKAAAAVLDLEKLIDGAPLSTAR